MRFFYIAKSELESAFIRAILFSVYHRADSSNYITFDDLVNREDISSYLKAKTDGFLNKIIVFCKSELSGLEKLNENDRFGDFRSPCKIMNLSFEV